ncbi:LINE-1 type transposase domain-containing protein 1 [Acipenser ruthenus]|uniref:LINE-1 type transposase domain-containing protein 1 n=1 Tax=Acipenser ruthenus TaxID=7906 RepID=A0A662YW80_ACIRT|nr:LINE-1 type transposase domain-containing protein 1 [Acipenser ruthenus]
MKRSLGTDDWDVRLAEVARTFHGSVQEAIDAALQPVNRNVTETATILNALKQEVFDIASSMKQITARQDITRADLRQQKDKINQCNACTDAMQDKMVVLEDRSRRCNVRLVRLPEGADGDDLIHFLQQKIQHWYLILKSSDVHPFLEFNRAHRVYTVGPRTVIFQRLRYNDRQRLLQAARKSTQSSYRGKSSLFMWITLLSPL